MDDSERATTRVALAISRDRDRDLLTSLFAGQDVVEIDDDVPARTDICVVDEAGFPGVATALAEWRDDQHPTFAPVLLLAASETSNPWAQYEDERSDRIDAIKQIPAPKSAITARVENLLEMREFSRKLATEHQLTERIFDTSPMAKIVLDTDGDIVRANRRAEDVLGPSKSAITGRTDDDPEWRSVDESGAPIPDDDLPFARVIETGDPVYGYEHGIERPDGDSVWLSVNMAPIRDGSGEIEYVVGALEDITVRRAQERELDRQLDLFEKAQAIADVGAWEYDVVTGEMFWTAELARIYGLSPEVDPSPELRLEHYHPEDRPVIEAAFERALEDGDPYDLELRLVDADGDTRWVRTRGEPQFDDGELVRIRGTTQDITDQKERELELQQMTRAVDKAPIGVVITDPDLEDNPLIYVNEGFEEVTGYSRAEATGRNCRFLQGERTDPETVAEIRQAIDAAEPVSAVLRNYRADGTEFWNKLDIAPVRDADGEVINFIGFQQDTTERVERQRQLQTLDRYLRHNLRNDMNVVQGLAELIQEASDPPLSEYAERITETSTSLVESMEKQREITKVLGDEPVVEPVELLTACRSIVAELRTRYPAGRISLSGPETATVRATSRLPVALKELISNAFDHNDSETADVRIEVSTGPDETTVRIADNGPGFPAGEVDVLTGVSEETPLNHGQGLGLWLAYLILRRSGGRIEFEDDTRGSVVTVVLPTADGDS